MNKDRILRCYHVWPVAHQVLVRPARKAGCAGPLEDRYYLFGYRKRTDQGEAEEGSFFCGDHVADEFLRLLNLERLRLFNPLHVPVPIVGPGHPEEPQEAHDGDEHEPWDALNREVFAVINLLIAIRDMQPRAQTLDTLTTIRQRPSLRIQAWRVRTLSNYLHVLYPGTTFQQVLTEFRVHNADLRQYTFPEIRATLAGMQAENHIDP